GIHWNGDWAQLATKRPHDALYPPAGPNRIDSVRRHLYQSALRTLALREQFPENLYLGEVPEPIAMTEAEIAQLAHLEATQPSTRFSGGQMLLMLIAGVVLGSLCGLRGIAKIKL